MPRKMNIRAMAALVVAIACVLSGCSKPKAPATELASALYEMGKQEKWPETMPLAKKFALAYPSDPASHYLLGQAYLHRAEPHLVQAEGELKTALALLQRNNALGAVTWANENEFRLALCRDLALVDFRWIREAMRFKLDPKEIRDKLVEAKGLVEQGLKYDPSDSFLKEMHGTIEDYLSGPYKGLAPPTA